MQKIVPIVVLAAALVGCDSSSPTALDPRDVTFAPELGIDLDAMTMTSSGLYYQDVQVGTGTEAVAGRRVSVLYQGWLPDGTLFDAATDSRDPLVFRLGVGMVIRGWDEGVQGMRVGGIRTLVIPPSLGYGDRPMGPIPANSVLVFRIELLRVE
jgi:FKBP-type peptidyl-prolyl cis-trans isomerase FkpA